MTEPVPVTVQTSRAAMLAIAGLGALVIVLAVVLLLVVRDGGKRDQKIGQLACQVERMGGKPIGKASCSPSVKPAVRTTPVPSPVPSRVVVTVRPRTAPEPRTGPSPRRTTKPAGGPSARPSPSRAPSPKPSPTETCIRPLPVPVSVCR